MRELISRVAYRAASEAILHLVKEHVGPRCPVERLGLDEFFVDFSAQVPPVSDLPASLAELPATHILGVYRVFVAWKLLYVKLTKDTGAL
jgi:nucleotidyltransferase/DNA polymerase involved in DNA repair